MINVIFKVAVVCVAVDIIYEFGKKHDVAGKVKAKFAKK